MQRPERPFARVHFDLVGPFDESLNGHTYILTLMCPFTQFPFALPVKSKEAEECAKELVTVFSLVGNPDEVVSDRAREFVGEVMQAVNKTLGIKHIKTSGYQPQGNLVER